MADAFTTLGVADVAAVPDLPSRLTREELALLWRVSPRTIERREATGTGPRPMKIGGRVLYRREDVLAWEQAQITDPGA